MLLLDTNIAVHLRDRNPATLDRFAENPIGAQLSLISLVELEGGVAAVPGKSAERRAALNVLLNRITIVPFDRPVVDEYTAIVARLGFSRPRILDRLIAATAIVHGLTLITANGSDFRDIPGLDLEIWPAPVQ